MPSNLNYHNPNEVTDSPLSRSRFRGAATAMTSVNLVILEGIHCSLSRAMGVVILFLSRATRDAFIRIARTKTTQKKEGAPSYHRLGAEGGRWRRAGLWGSTIDCLYVDAPVRILYVPSKRSYIGLSRISRTSLTQT